MEDWRSRPWLSYDFGYMKVCTKFYPIVIDRLMCLLGTSPGASDLIPETLSIARKNTQSEMKRSGDGNEKWQQRNTKETKI